MCNCFVAIMVQAGPTGRRSRSGCGQVASYFYVKEVLWVKMESLQSLGDIAEVICLKSFRNRSKYPTSVDFNFLWGC